MIKCCVCNNWKKEPHRYNYYRTDKPVCEDCMKGSNTHGICPICGKLVPNEHMMGNLCDIDAPNYD